MCMDDDIDGEIVEGDTIIDDVLWSEKPLTKDAVLAEAARRNVILVISRISQIS